jgi:hypothetical protein
MFTPKNSNETVTRDSQSRFQVPAWLPSMQLANIQLAWAGIGARETIHYLSLCRKTALKPIVNYKNGERICVLPIKSSK